MYLMRVDASGELLRIECSGDVTTAEAVRAVSQAAALAEAGNIWAMAADLTRVERGPAGAMVLAAAMAAAHREGLRVAWIAGPAGRATIERVTRFAGLKHACRIFDSEPAAATWLGVARERASAHPPLRVASRAGRTPVLAAGGSPSAA